MIIVGAGLAGLIAYRMLRGLNDINVMVVERQANLPNNHEALLRFRSTDVSTVIRIPFKQVTVRKGVVVGETYVDKINPYIANRYSLKVSGSIGDRSIWDTKDAIRWVAPSDLVEQLRPERITFGRTFQFADKRKFPVISTIPMPLLMDIIGWPSKPVFISKSIWTLRAEIVSPHNDVHQTLYFPEHDVPYYRATLTGGSLIVEYATNEEASEDDIGVVLSYFGIDSSQCKVISNYQLKEHKFGKIVPIDENERKKFIFTMSRECGIYSLGRFATWRPILLDDIVQDVWQIARLIEASNSADNYKHALATVSGNNSTKRH